MEALIIFFNWAFIVCLSYLFGRLFFLIIDKHGSSPQILNFPLVVLSGLIVINILACWLSLFFPISGEVLFCFILTGLTIAFFLRKTLTSEIQIYFQLLKSFSPITKIFLPLFFILLSVYLSSRNSLIYDDFLYYIQTVKWINNYPVIPGLGNVHGRLAFNSNWHLLNSLFNLSFLFNKSFNDLNGLILLILSLYAIGCLDGLIKNNQSIKNLIGSFFILPTYLFLQNYTAPTPDIPATYLIWLSLLLFLVFLNNEEKINPLLIVLLAAYTITVKVSSIIIALVVIFIFFKLLLNKNFRETFQLGLLCLLIFTPWLIRNVILSGYLIYPFHELDLFNFDWEIPKSDAIMESQLIKGWARIPGEDSWRYAALPVSEWIIPWFRRIKLTNLLILFLIAGTTIFGSVFLLKKQFANPGFVKVHFPILALYLILYSGILFWFFQAPNFRFGYGFLMFFCFLTIGLIFHYFSPKLSYLLKIFFLVIAISQLLSVQQLYSRRSEFNSPEKIISYQKINGGETSIFIPKDGEQCGDSPLPCANRRNLKLKFRGNSIEAGFKQE